MTEERKHLLVGTAGLVAAAVVIYFAWKEKQASESASAAETAQEDALSQETSSSSAYQEYAALPSISIPSLSSSSSVSTDTSSPVTASTSSTSDDTMLSSLLSAALTQLNSQTSQTGTTTNAMTIAPVAATGLALTSYYPSNTVSSSDTIAGQTQSGLINSTAILAGAQTNNIALPTQTTVAEKLKGTLMAGVTGH